MRIALVLKTRGFQWFELWYQKVTDEQGGGLEGYMGVVRYIECMAQAFDSVWQMYAEDEPNFMLAIDEYASQAVDGMLVEDGFGCDLGNCCGGGHDQ